MTDFSTAARHALSGLHLSSKHLAREASTLARVMEATDAEARACGIDEAEIEETCQAVASTFRRMLLTANDGRAHG